MSFLGTVIAGIAGRPRKLGDQPAIPEYYTDPNFSGTQSFLKSYSEDILKGNIPDYYKGIGQTMDPSLMKDYVYSLGSDISGQELARQALSGRARTGMSNNAIAQVGQLSADARMTDYLNSIEGKKWLMQFGGVGEEGVRDAASWNQEQNNAFNQWNYGAKLSNEQRLQARRDMIKAYDQNAIANTDTAFWNDVSSGFSGMSQMYGGGSGGMGGMGGMGGGMSGGTGGSGGGGLGGIFGGIATATKGYMSNPYNTSSYWGSPSQQQAGNTNPAIDANYGKTQTKGSQSIDISTLMKLASMIGA